MAVSPQARGGLEVADALQVPDLVEHRPARRQIHRVHRIGHHEMRSDLRVQAPGAGIVGVAGVRGGEQPLDVAADALRGVPFQALADHPLHQAVDLQPPPGCVEAGQAVPDRLPRDPIDRCRGVQQPSERQGDRAPSAIAEQGEADHLRRHEGEQLQELRGRRRLAAQPAERDGDEVRDPAR
jgi:hypothetical protein